MHKLINKIAVAATAGISVLGLSTAAMAGEGGVAGAAAFTIDNSGAAPVVTGVAVAAAVGKQDASAAAYNVPESTLATDVGVQNYAYSIGSAGVISISAMGDPENAEMAGSADTALADEQGNSFNADAPGAIQLGTSTGDDLVDFGEIPAPTP